MAAHLSADIEPEFLKLLLLLLLLLRTAIAVSAAAQVGRYSRRRESNQQCFYCVAMHVVYVQQHGLRRNKQE